MNSVTTWVGQWLSQRRPEELHAMAQQDVSLVSELQAYRPLVKMYKGITKGITKDISISADTLLDYCLANYPQHGLVLMNDRKWYNRQIDELRQYIENL